MNVEIYTVAVLKKRRRKQGVVVCLVKEGEKYLEAYFNQNDLLDYFVEGYFGSMSNSDVITNVNYIKPDRYDYSLIKRERVTQLYKIVKVYYFLKLPEVSKFKNQGNFFTMKF